MGPTALTAVGMKLLNIAFVACIPYMRSALANLQADAEAYHETTRSFPSLKERSEYHFGENGWAPLHDAVFTKISEKSGPRKKGSTL